MNADECSIVRRYNYLGPSGHYNTSLINSDWDTNRWIHLDLVCEGFTEPARKQTEFNSLLTNKRTTFT